jgi:Zn-dependent protease
MSSFDRSVSGSHPEENSQQPHYDTLKSIPDTRRGETLMEKTSPWRLSIVSIMVAIGVYGLILGIPFAVGFVALILVHELGHLIVLKHLGYRSTSPIFIPFVGALIGMKDRPENAQNEALIAYGGPFVGSIGAYAVYLYYLYSGDRFFLLLAFVGFLINLFNMIPVSPMDGGRIATAISRWMWLPGMAGLLYLYLQIWNPLLLLIMAIGGFRVWKSLFGTDELVQEGYYTVEPRIRMLITLAYVVLLIFLVRLTMVTFHQLQ